MTKTPSDCIDHEAPFLIYVTTEGQGEPIMLTIVSKEGGQRERWPISDARWLLLMGEVAPRIAGRPK